MNGDAESRAADRQDIRDAIQRYNRGLDRRDLDTALSAFHVDSIVRHGLFTGSGHDWVRFVLSRPVIDRVGTDDADLSADVVESRHHHLTNQLIELHGELAYSETYFLEYTTVRRAQQRYLTSVGGRYAEQYARRRGVWRIIERTAVRDWDSITSVPGRVPGWAEGPQGTRDRTDGSYWSGQAGIVPPSPVDDPE